MKVFVNMSVKVFVKVFSKRPVKTKYIIYTYIYINILNDTYTYIYIYIYTYINIPCFYVEQYEPVYEGIY